MVTLLLTRPRARADAFLRALAPLDATVVFADLTESVALENSLWQPPSGPFNWLLFTSAVAVGLVGDMATRNAAFSALIGPASVTAVGPATAQALTQALTQARALASWKATLMPQVFTATDAARTVLAQHRDTSPIRALWPCSALSDAAPLMRLFEAEGHALVPWPIYDTRARATLDAATQAALQSPLDAIAFTSPSTVNALTAWITPAPGALLAAIGPTTGSQLRARLGRCDLIADEHTLDGLGAALALRLAAS